MARAGFVSFREADKTYRLGLAVAELAVGMIGSSHLDLIRPEIERLALNHGMLIALWRITDDGHIVVLDRAFGADMVRVDMRVGSRLPRSEEQTSELQSLMSISAPVFCLKK